MNNETGFNIFYYSQHSSNFLCYTVRNNFNGAVIMGAKFELGDKVEAFEVKGVVHDKRYDVLELVSCLTSEKH
jgi:hypothetical protein